MIGILRIGSLLFLLCLPATVFAQLGGYWREDEFWTRLRETERALMQAGVASDSANLRAALLDVWRDVRGVSLDDGTVIELDLDWLRQPLESGDTDSLTRLQSHIRALLADSAVRTRGVGEGASLDALAGVLRDPRFQYAEVVTPTPIATPVFDDLVVTAPSISPGISQFILIGIGVTILIAVILNFARVLQVQPARASGSEAETDDPKTASDATDFAATHAAQGDYRSAIRYLYLSSLLWLNERGALRYDATLTNREHLRQLRAQTQTHDLLRGIVNMFEDVWYGDLAIDEAFYARFVQQVEALRRVLS